MNHMSAGTICMEGEQMQGLEPRLLLVGNST